jgi:hypothetical protein
MTEPKHPDPYAPCSKCAHEYWHHRAPGIAATCLVYKCMCEAFSPDTSPQSTHSPDVSTQEETGDTRQPEEIITEAAQWLAAEAHSSPEHHEAALYNNLLDCSVCAPRLNAALTALETLVKRLDNARGAVRLNATSLMVLGEAADERIRHIAAERDEALADHTDSEKALIDTVNRLTKERDEAQAQGDDDMPILVRQRDEAIRERDEAMRKLDSWHDLVDSETRRVAAMQKQRDELAEALEAAIHYEETGSPNAQEWLDKAREALKKAGRTTPKEAAHGSTEK